jgi:predicted acetyltransferase
MRVAAVKTLRKTADFSQTAAPRVSLDSPCLSDQPKIREMIRSFLSEINVDGDEDEDARVTDPLFCLYDDNYADQNDGLSDGPYNKRRDNTGIVPACRFHVFERIHPDSDVDTRPHNTVDTPSRADWTQLGSLIWWERPTSLLPMLIREGDSPVGFLLVTSAPFTEPDTDYEVAGLFVMPVCRRRGVARAALLAAFDRFPGRWEAVPANMDDAFGFWFNLIDGHFWEYQLDPDGTGFQFENVPANIKCENPFHADAGGVTNGNKSIPPLSCRSLRRASSAIQSRKELL